MAQKWLVESWQSEATNHLCIFSLHLGFQKPCVFQSPVSSPMRNTCYVGILNLQMNVVFGAGVTGFAAHIGPAELIAIACYCKVKSDC